MFKSVTVGSDQIWLVLFGCAPQLNKGAEHYIFKTGLSICKQHQQDNMVTRDASAIISSPASGF